MRINGVDTACEMSGWRRDPWADQQHWSAVAIGFIPRRWSVDAVLTGIDVMRNPGKQAQVDMTRSKIEVALMCLFDKVKLDYAAEVADVDDTREFGQNCSMYFGRAQQVTDDV